ncbi:hypothetical protein ACFFX0_21270 [Citricoccus parietis]|uniref:Uncharacterized protein n=1 Tax=Citricoccus parietis TaxID=592307 RepID=A0ABV5G548_9MICC
MPGGCGPWRVCRSSSPPMTVIPPSWTRPRRACPGGWAGSTSSTCS